MLTEVQDTLCYMVPDLQQIEYIIPGIEECKKERPILSILLMTHFGNLYYPPCNFVGLLVLVPKAGMTPLKVQRKNSTMGVDTTQ